MSGKTFFKLRFLKSLLLKAKELYVGHGKVNIPTKQGLINKINMAIPYFFKTFTINANSFFNIAPMKITAIGTWKKDISNKKMIFTITVHLPP